MLYFFTGENEFLLKKEVFTWKNAFTEKYGVENCLHIFNENNIDLTLLRDNLTSLGLFAHKRLVIIDGILNSSTHDESVLLELVGNAPDDIIVVVTAINPDKRKSLYKKLLDLGEVKQFQNMSEGEVSYYLQQKYSNIIDNQAIGRLIFLKGASLEKCIQEIEKLSLTHDLITIQEINSYTLGEYESSIFTLLDSFLAGNSRLCFETLKVLQNSGSFFPLYQGFLSNIRVFVYIQSLRKQNYDTQKIIKLLGLGNRSFLLQKKNIFSSERLTKIYEEFILIDQNIKTGRYPSSDEKFLFGELERIFLLGFSHLSESRPTQ